MYLLEQPDVRMLRVHQVVLDDDVPDGRPEFVPVISRGQRLDRQVQRVVGLAGDVYVAIKLRH